MTGRYCHQCGQDVFAGAGIPILILIVQILDNVFALDGKTPKTLGSLLIRPGFLSKEYMNGRISRYVNPVKLFWMSTIIFFAILISQFDINTDNLFNTQSNTESNGDELSLETIEENTSTGNLEIIDNEQEVQVDLNFQIYKDKVDTEKLQQMLPEIFTLFKNNFAKIAPYIAFLLIPFFALLLALFFWRSKYYYIHNLIFTIHFHTFLWIFMTLLLVLNMFISLQYPDWLIIMLLITPGIYLVFALHSFYYSKLKRSMISWWNSIWKAILITFFYLILISIVFLFLIKIVIRLKYPELFLT